MGIHIFILQRFADILVSLIGHLQRRMIEHPSWDKALCPYSGPIVRVPKPPQWCRGNSRLWGSLQIRTRPSGKGGTRANPGTHPTLETNKQVLIKKSTF